MKKNHPIRLLLLSLLLLPLLLASPVVYARGILQGYVGQGNGTALTTLAGATLKVQKSYPNATVTIYAADGVTPITTTLVYSNSTGSVKGNPFTADNNGYWFCWLDDGVYYVKFTGGGITGTIQLSAIRVSSGAGVYNIRDCGATGNGTTDDATAIQTCIDQAYALGGVKATVIVPAGTFIIGPAGINVKCQLTGSGTLKTKTGNTIVQTITIPTGYDGAGIAGISIDGNLSGSTEATYAGTYGLLVHSNNVTVERVKVRNTFGPAIYVGLSNATRLSGVRIINNDLATGRSREVGPGQIAYSDGVQTEWTDGIVVRDNVITDYMRGGVVIEGDTTLQSQNAQIVGNLISNMTGAGSGGQINYGVWCENTLTATIAFNTITNAGRGVNLSPTNGALEAYFDLVGNQFIASYKPAIVLGGSSGAKSRINVIGGSIRGTVTAANQQLLVSGTSGDILIEAVHFGAWTPPNNSAAANIGVDAAASTNPIRSLTIRNCTHESSSFPNVDSGDINVITTTNLQDLEVLDNPGSWSMLMQGVGATVRARNTILTKPSATFAVINAVTAEYAPSGATRIYTVAGGSSTPIASTDGVVLSNYSGGAGTQGYTIAAGSARGRVVIVKDYSGSAVVNNIVVTATGTTIDGAASKTINAAGGSMKIQLVDGAAWQSVP